MRIPTRSVALAALTLVIMSCSDRGGLGPTVSTAPQLSTGAGGEPGIAAVPAVRISEIHYDNTGTDAGERIEVSAPAGTSLTGWSIVLYNGSNGTVYDTDPLTGLTPTTCDTRLVVVLAYPVNGIQNGAPDGVALVNAASEVVEFLSYEGTFTAAGGPANGMLSTDIGVSEAGNEPIGQSLKRNGAGTWSGPSAENFGACNDNDEPPPPPPPPPAPTLPPTRLVEIHYDNAGTDAGEAIEIEGPAGTDVTGWNVVLYNGDAASLQPYDTVALTGTISDACTGRGVVVLNYAQNGIQNGSPDGVALVDATGNVVEFLSYEGTFTATNGPAAGKTSTDIGVSEPSSSPLGHSLQRKTDGAWEGPKPATFGGCNSGGAPAPPANTITFSGRTASDPALPVGFEDQIFALLRSPTGDTIATTFTWTSETPTAGSIDQRGVLRALGTGTVIIRATATVDGTTATYSLPTRIATASTTAEYQGNAEFGEPADGDPDDDFIVRRAQYTASYNHARGTPNWVSYNLDATHFGPEDRCDCFTFDPDLPATYRRYTTADYTGAGAFHGYGIDRGHLARSFDRTSGSLDNATTFYFTNIIPQAADNNQGPWAAFESYLGDLARFQNKEVYIVAGVDGSKGTVKDEGKITIPARVWKVAVIMARNHGLANVRYSAELEFVAVSMPNDPGIRNVNWEAYRTTVDAIEAASAYDLLANLPDRIEAALEKGDRAPVAKLSAPTTGAEGESLTFDASESTDPDVGDVLTYEWDFGDGTTGTGTKPTHTYADNGTYTVKVRVVDQHGADAIATRSVTVTNVAPTIRTLDLPPKPLGVGAPAEARVGYTDPGSADTHALTVNWGDGTTSTVAGANGVASASHAYAAAGFYIVTVTVTDDDGASAQRTSGEYIIVYDVRVGFVTGAGWIDRPNVGPRGRVAFGFGAQYRAGAVEPDGVMGLRLFYPTITDFTAERLEWLVVTRGTAYLKGIGAIHGRAGTYHALIALKDGGTPDSSGDLVRIRLWSADGTVLYDSQPGAPVPAPPTTPAGGGGSVQLTVPR